ncbi:collagen alpha-1(I) chain-like [Perognathus longimembris pacificus]|uniref:collagen alpha-1(I) chain-like n=1 Tax=Perognathus longimembris pacificus TaxID=214514 RepID=UPI002019AD6E|nr:collagen alpha-1(I) chain-like [Perognathus longimembris pacificus]
MAAPRQPGQVPSAGEIPAATQTPACLPPPPLSRGGCKIAEPKDAPEELDRLVEGPAWVENVFPGEVGFSSAGNRVAKTALKRWSVDSGSPLRRVLCGLGHTCGRDSWWVDWRERLPFAFPSGLRASLSSLLRGGVTGQPQRRPSPGRKRGHALRCRARAREPRGSQKAQQCGGHTGEAQGRDGAAFHTPNPGAVEKVRGPAATSAPPQTGGDGSPRVHAANKGATGAPGPTLLNKGATGAPGPTLLNKGATGAPGPTLLNKGAGLRVWTLTSEGNIPVPQRVALHSGALAGGRSRPGQSSAGQPEAGADMETESLEGKRALGLPDHLPPPHDPPVRAGRGWCVCAPRIPRRDVAGTSPQAERGTEPAEVKAGIGGAVPLPEALHAGSGTVGERGLRPGPAEDGPTEAPPPRRASHGRHGVRDGIGSRSTRTPRRPGAPAQTPQLSTEHPQLGTPQLSTEHPQLGHPQLSTAHPQLGHPQLSTAHSPARTPPAVHRLLLEIGDKSKPPPPPRCPRSSQCLPCEPRPGGGSVAGVGPRLLSATLAALRRSSPPQCGGPVFHALHSPFSFGRLRWFGLCPGGRVSPGRPSFGAGVQLCWGVAWSQQVPRSCRLGRQDSWKSASPCSVAHALPGAPSPPRGPEKGAAEAGSKDDLLRLPSGPRGSPAETPQTTGPRGSRVRALSPALRDALVILLLLLWCPFFCFGELLSTSMAEAGAHSHPTVLPVLGGLGRWRHESLATQGRGRLSSPRPCTDPHTLPPCRPAPLSPLTTPSARAGDSGVQPGPGPSLTTPECESRGTAGCSPARGLRSQPPVHERGTAGCSPARGLHSPPLSARVGGQRGAARPGAFTHRPLSGRVGGQQGAARPGAFDHNPECESRRMAPVGSSRDRGPSVSGVDLILLPARVTAPSACKGVQGRARGGGLLRSRPCSLVWTPEAAPRLLTPARPGRRSCHHRAWSTRRTPSGESFRGSQGLRAVRLLAASCSLRARGQNV